MSRKWMLCVSSVRDRGCKKAAGVNDVVPDVKAPTVAITYDPKKTTADALVTH